MKYFYATYQDFVRFNVKPNEDSLLVSKRFPIFAVADGVTQSHYSNERYNLPYGAKEAANIFCQSVVHFLEREINIKNTNEKEIKNAIKKAFNTVNKKIKELNEKHGIQKRVDYKKHDWFDTVGIVAVKVKNNLYYGFVGDCGLIVLNKNNKKKFQTKNMVRLAVKRFNAMYPHWQNFDPLKRQFIIRKDFRNNPNKKGYGSFTGQPEVEHYYTIGKKQLNKWDMVVLYSDGFFELLKNKDFVQILRKQDKKQLNKFVMQKAKEDSSRFGDDRTFISFII